MICAMYIVWDPLECRWGPSGTVDTPILAPDIKLQHYKTKIPLLKNLPFKFYSILNSWNLFRSYWKEMPRHSHSLSWKYPINNLDKFVAYVSNLFGRISFIIYPSVGVETNFAAIIQMDVLTPKIEIHHFIYAFFL